MAAFIPDGQNAAIVYHMPAAQRVYDMQRTRIYAAGLFLALTLLFGALTHAQSLATRNANGCATITLDGRDVLKYFSQPHPYKMYVAELRTPAGIQILRDSPVDHVHHHGLMFAIGIDGVDFWGEAPDGQPGKQQSSSYSSSSWAESTGMSAVRIGQTVNWTSAADERLAVEQRTITCYPALEQNLVQLTWQATMQPADGKDAVQLWGRHYFGLGMRFVESMDKGGRFFNPSGQEGKIVRGTERLVRAPWCAFAAQVDGQEVTVAMFDHPGNPRHPATWFTMNGPFSYLAATLDLEHEKLTVSRQTPFKARYGVAVWDGEIKESQVQAAYQRWLELDD